VQDWLRQASKHMDVVSRYLLCDLHLTQVQVDGFWALLCRRDKKHTDCLIRTTNGLERLNREIRRRSRIANLFPNDASCLRLVTAVVMDISKDWQTGRRYIKWESDE